MPVSIIVPTRLRVDAASLADGREQLRGALTAAATRALVNSRHAVLDSRGGFVRAVAQPAEVTWTGDGLPGVTPAMRANTEFLIAETLGEALRTAGISRHGGGNAPHALPSRISEPFDPSRFDAETGTYAVAVYQQKGAGRPVPLGQKQAGDTETSTALAYLMDGDDVVVRIQQFYNDPRPKGTTRYGVYGIWVPDGIPSLFWVQDISEEGASKGRATLLRIGLVAGKLENGRWVSSQSTPITAALGARYRLETLPKPRQMKGVPYEATMRKEGATRAEPAFLPAESLALIRGKTIHFGVASDVMQTVTVTASRAPQEDAPAPRTPGRPPWELWYWADSLPAEPQDGIEGWLWWWYGWFNVQPAEMRANPLVRQVFTDWDNAGSREDFNPLFLHIYKAQFYEAFCRLVALEMLATSQSNMRDFLSAFDREKPRLAKRLATLLEWLSQPARVVADIESILNLETELDQKKRSFEDQQRWGPLPGGIITSEEIDDLERRLEAARQAQGGEEEERDRQFLQMAQELDPLLTLLTLRDGKEVSTIDQAVLSFWQLVESSGSADAVVEYIRQQLEALVRHTADVEAEIRADGSDVYKLAFVQEEANRRLAPWLARDPFFREIVERDIAGPGILIYLGMGIAVLVITFIFPPLGLVLGAAMSVTFAVGSVSNALRLSRWSKARIAQAGFRPLVSEGEVNAAIFQASVDVFFAIVDLGVLAHSVGQLGRTAAREAGGALARSLEPMLAGWRQFGKWPEELLQGIRGQIRNEMDVAASASWKGMGEAEKRVLLDELVELAQGQMHARYQQRLLRFQTEFAEALETGRLSPRDIEGWLKSEFPRPQEFFKDLAEKELSSGKELFESSVARRLAGQPPLVLGAFDFMGKVSEAELTALARELGPQAELLRPDRLRALGESTRLTYPELARRLKSILDRVAEPSASLSRLEDLLVGRREAADVLAALERTANPRRVIERLTPEMLATSVAGGLDELVEAAGRGSSAGEVGRLLSDIDASGSRRLFREVKPAGGASFFERWDGAAAGWVRDASIRVAAEVPGARVLQAVTTQGRDAALKELQDLAAATTKRGAPTAAAGRIGEMLERVRTHAAFDEILNVGAREGKQVAADILESLEPLVGPGSTAELDGVAEFLRRGGEGRALADILGIGFDAGHAYQRDSIRLFLSRLKIMNEGDFRGVALVMAERGYGRGAAENVINIVRNYPDDSSHVFEALYKVAPHADGLSHVIADLASISSSKNMGALGQLFAAKQMLERFPGRRVVLEESIVEGTTVVKGRVVPRVVRKVDVRVVTPFTRITVLDTEVKEITEVMWLGTDHAIQEFERDVVRSTLAAARGERPLGRILWMVRDWELGPAGVSKAQIRDTLGRAFEPGRLGALTAPQREAALRDFQQNFGEIIEFF